MGARFGPASESPSRLQRFVVAGHPLVEAVFMSAVTSVSMGIYALVRSGSVATASGFTVAVLVLFTPAYHVLVGRKTGTRQERGDRLVLYPHGLPTLHGPGQRRLALLVVVLSCLGIARGLLGLATSSTSSHLALTALSVLSLLFVGRVLHKTHTEKVNPDDDAADDPMTMPDHHERA